MRLLWPVLLLASTSCSEERTRAEPGGVHPAGWADRTSASFHANWMKANAFPLPRCQECHGDDYGGGAVGVSCSQASCHQASPIACTTCHGSNGTPRPNTGAHWAHEAYCSTCHQVPVETTASVQHHANGDASTLIDFSGIAIADAGTGAPPTWDPGAQRCTNTYCHHGSPTPVWTTTSQIQCDGCHLAPPTDHARWARLATTPDSCTTCHPAPSEPTHINGVVDVTVTSCTTCHGSNDHPNPPTSLDGSTDPSARGVGAHVRHLDATLPDRIGKPLACNDCHAVPTAVLQAGHFDQPETQVRFPFGGAYDRTSASCAVWCHFDKVPGPTWTDDTGAARKCDACHAFPPTLTRAGTPHPSVAGELSVCVRCHVYGVSTHVNGVVDFVPP